MTREHQITPPTELVLQWLGKHLGRRVEIGDVEQVLANKAARWGADQQLQLDAEQINQAWQKGADQELEACLEEIRDGAGRVYIGESKLRVRLADYIWTARRPKPLSLKEQALEAIVEMANCMKAGFIPKRSDLDTIRRALEQLDD